MGQSSKSSETPAHPSWISRFCGDQSGGGWREVLSESEETNIWSPLGEWMDGWLVGYIEGWVIKGCGRVNGELGLIPQHHSYWQIDGQRQTTAASTVRDKHSEGFFFHSQWQHRSRSWLRGLNHLYTDNVPLWNLIQPCGAIQSLVFLCPLCTQIKLAWSKSQQIKTSQTNFKRTEVNSTSCALEEIILDQPDDSLL